MLGSGTKTNSCILVAQNATARPGTTSFRDSVYYYHFYLLLVAMKFILHSSLHVIKLDYGIMDVHRASNITEPKTTSAHLDVQVGEYNGQDVALRSFWKRLVFPGSHANLLHLEHAQWGRLCRNNSRGCWEPSHADLTADWNTPHRYISVCMAVSLGALFCQSFTVYCAGVGKGTR